MTAKKLFLSYSRTDGDAVRTIRELLTARGAATFFDRADLVPGESWPQALEGALSEAAAAAVFVGRGGFGTWQKREMYFALDRQARSEGTGVPFPVVPVLLPGADPKAGFLFLNTWVDLRQDIRDPEALAILDRAAKGHAPQAAADWDARTFCPYRGLRSFEEEDAPFFFGREELSERLLEATLRESFLTVVGPSGSGKSSAVIAGLVPLLRRRRPPEATWDVVSFRPGDRPFHRLAAALLPELEPGLSETDRLLEVEKLGTGLEERDIRLPDVVERLLLRSNGTDRLLIVADQFEELFTLTPTEKTRKNLIEVLLGTVATAPVQVVMTLRADFYGHTIRLDRDLSDRIERALVNVGPMHREELQRAIEKPARRVGLELESGLVGRILDDLGEEPGTLPLLEFALTELWERRRDGRLTHAAYESIGEVGGAIARRAEAEFHRISGAQQRAARTLLTRLVRVARPEEGTQDTRRRAVVGELGVAERAVLHELTSPEVRLLVTDRDEATGEETAELVHDALVRTWPRLRRWLDEDREFLLWRQRVGLKLAEWQRTEHDAGALLRGASLTEAERWLAEREDELGEEEQRYVEASVELREAARLQEHRRKRSRTIASGAAIVVLLIFAAVIGVLYVSSERRAEQLWANSLVTSAEAASDPLVGVLLIGELREDLYGGEPPHRWIELGRRLAGTPVPVAVLRGHEGFVSYAAFSRDGSRVVTASEDGTARVWAADGTGEPVVLSDHEATVGHATFSPDGSRVVTASQDRTARVWAADGTGEPLVLRGHVGGVTYAEFSPDGSRLVTASEDGTARVWAADGTGEPVVLRGHARGVSHAAFNQDGSRVVTASWDGTARVWAADGTGEPLVLRGHVAGVMYAEFSPDGSKVVTASAEDTARVWDATGRDQPVILRGHQLAVVHAAFSSDGLRVLTASWDGTARVWASDGAGKPVVLGGQEFLVWHSDLSPDGLRMEAASADRTARVLVPDGTGTSAELAIQEQVLDLPESSPDGSRVAMTGRFLVLGPQERLVTAKAGSSVLFGIQERFLSHAEFSPDGSRVVTASLDGTARVWAADGTGEPMLLRGHGERLMHVAFSRDGSKVVTASADGTARIWAAEKIGEPVVLEGHRLKYPVMHAEFSPDGWRVVTASTDHTARMWAAGGTGESVVLRGHDGWVWHAAFSPDGSRVVTASQDRTARVWAADGSGESVVLRGHDGSIGHAEFSPDGSRVVTASQDRTARVWAADGSGEPVVLRGHDGSIGHAEFSSNGSKIVTASRDGTARVWAADGSGEPLVLKGHKKAVSSATFSSDGSRVVTASEDGTARVWAADGTGEPIVLRGDEEAVLHATFSPDGSRVVTASEDGTARVWTADGTGELVVLKGHRNIVWHATFSPDGSRVVTASEDGTARVWAADGTGEPIVLRGHEAAVLHATFGPDSSRIVTASADGTARLWTLGWSALLGRLRDVTTACLDVRQRGSLLAESPEVARARYKNCEHRHGRKPDV